MAREIQHRQSKLVRFSNYHLEAAANLLNIDAEEISPKGVLPCSRPKNLDLPSDTNELMVLTLQLASTFEFCASDVNSQWAQWLTSNGVCRGSLKAQKALSSGVGELFQKADDAVDDAIHLLELRGFEKPSADHLFQTARNANQEIPSQLIRASISKKNLIPQRNATIIHKTAQKVHHEDVLSSGEMLGRWGFADTSFTTVFGEDRRAVVEMKGRRYNLSGRRMSSLIPFIERELAIRIDLTRPLKATPSNEDVGDLQTAELLVNRLLEICAHVSNNPHELIRCGTGHCQQDIFAIRSGDQFRTPDAVVWPATEDEVTSLVAAATKYSWCLIPVGGGTNVTQATRSPSSDLEPRTVVAVNMKRMKKLLWVNAEDGLVHVEAGITGGELDEELSRHGLTCGHEPDSYEFSTLGGWVATKASGMKRSKYGNIEDIVKGVRVVAAKGTLVHGYSLENTAWGRESTGPDLSTLILGSEGCLGIVTSVVLRVWKLPSIVSHLGVLFHDFESGLRFAREVAKLRASGPTSFRLLDNTHFRLGQALRPDPESLLESLGQHVSKQMLKWTGSHFEAGKVTCATMTFEGGPGQIEMQKRAIRQLARCHGGQDIGPGAGKSGYELTFMVAYLRDFALTYNVLGESFETFVPWSKIVDVVKAVRGRIEKEHSQRYLPGSPFVGCRVTQLYHEGVCLYFYFCMSVQNVPDASSVYAEIEHAARHEILRNGGSLSHHHGIGKVRAEFLTEIDSSTSIESICAIKEALDPDNIFGARNGPFACVQERKGLLGDNSTRSHV